MKVNHQTCEERLSIMRLKEVIFPQQQGPDKPIGVRCAIACFIFMCLSSAGYRSQGYIFIAMREHYGASAEEATWPISVNGFVMFTSGIFIGPMIQKYSVRPVLIIGSLCSAVSFLASYFALSTTHLILTYGIFNGIGSSSFVISQNVLMSQYFENYRSIAIGATSTGSALASFVFPNLMQALNTSLGFSMMMLIVGCIVLIMLPISCFMNDAPWMCKENPTKESESAFRQQLSIFTEPIFYVILLTNGAFVWAFDAYLTTVVDLAIQSGAERILAVNMMTWFAIADLAGRCLLPLLCDKNILAGDTLMLINYTLSAVYLALLPISSYLGMTVATFVVGPFFGLSSIFYQSLVAPYIGTDRMKVTFGLLMFFKGVLFFAKPSFIGYFRDVVGNYTPMYLLNAGIVFVFGCLWIPVIIRRRLKIKSENPEES